MLILSGVEGSTPFINPVNFLNSINLKWMIYNPQSGTTHNPPKSLPLPSPQ
jgi:hypothetical protein